MDPLDSAFTIEHNSGDPREPEYRPDGQQVRYAIYRQEGIYLRCKLLGSRENGSDQFNWTLEAPPQSREVLGVHWKSRRIVFERIVHYLEQLEAGKGSVPPGGYSSLSVDFSKVPGWLSARWNVLKRPLSPLIYTLPSARVLPVLALGYTIAYVRENQRIYDVLSNGAASGLLLSLGLLALLLLARETYRLYQTVLMTLFASNWYKKNYNFRTSALQILFAGFGRRIVTTSALSAFLIYLSAR